MKNQTVNAGVNNSNGIEFQKHCALYFWLANYDDIKDKNYSIFIEHLEDVFFCYKDGQNSIYNIDAYQAKKSADPWNSIPEFSSILKKISHVGLDLYEDDAPKTTEYIHTLSFVTNDSIKLSAPCNTNDKKKVNIIVNAYNSTIKYDTIPSEIKTKLEIGFDSDEKSQLENVYLTFIDFPKHSESQKGVLISNCQSVFGTKIIDYKAAIETLLLLFRKIENTVNNGNIARLNDTSKCVTSNEISNSVKIITTKKLAFDLWRKEANDICSKLEIPIIQRKNFELNFENCFDRFKDLKQVQHLTILSFVRLKMNDCNLFDEIKCINWLYEEFLKEKSSQLDELSIKAAIYAAYIEVREEIWA